MDAAFWSYTLNQNGEQGEIQGAEEEDGLIGLAGGTWRRCWYDI